MGERNGSQASEQFPPVGSPDRYDMIVQRGRALRRRRQYTLGAGAGGTVVALALAVVFVTGGGSGDEVHTDLAEDPTTTTEATTSTTTTVPPQVSARIDTSSKPVEIKVTDIEYPLISDAQQCADIVLRDPSTGTAVAEGRGCRYADAATTDGHVEVKLWPTEDGTEIGCAKSEVRIDEAALVAPTTTEVSTTFTYTVDENLPPGKYQLDVSAASGYGDGCAESTPGTTEVEESAEASTKIELP